MKNNKEIKKAIDVDDNFIVINKQSVIDYFFTSVLVIAVALFLVLFGMGAVKMAATPSASIDSSRISYFEDEFLNITYPIPGGEEWAIASIDTTELSETTDASKGADNYFSIDDDALTEEVLSCVCFNAGETGYREFMSYTFKPDVSYQDDEFIAFCEDSFKENIEDSGSYTSYELTGTTVDDSGGIMLTMKVSQVVKDEDDSGNVIERDMETFYTQYVKRIGENIATITYGSLIEDETVQPYLKHFLGNIVTEKSLIS